MQTSKSARSQVRSSAPNHVQPPIDVNLHSIATNSIVVFGNSIPFSTRTIGLDQPVKVTNRGRVLREKKIEREQFFRIHSAQAVGKSQAEDSQRQQAVGSSYKFIAFNTDTDFDPPFVCNFFAVHEQSKVINDVPIAPSTSVACSSLVLVCVSQLWSSSRSCSYSYLCSQIAVRNIHSPFCVLFPSISYKLNVDVRLVPIEQVVAVRIDIERRQIAIINMIGSSYIDYFVITPPGVL